MAITGYEWDFSFGLNGGPSHKDDPYFDHRHLTVLGRLLRPSDIALENMRITFIPDEDMEEESRLDFNPTGFGHLGMREDWIDGIFGMPMSALPPILTALGTGHHRYISFWGLKKRYRQAQIRSYRFTPSFDPEDYEPELLRA